MNIAPHIPKGARYTIGSKIDKTFLDLLESTYTAYFTDQSSKSDRISTCIFTLDILKFFISTAWEAKLLSHKQFEDMALKLDEAGKMFGGWKKSLEYPLKKNRTE
jgi:hypothetical protein